MKQNFSLILAIFMVMISLNQSIKTNLRSEIKYDGQVTFEKFNPEKYRFVEVTYRQSNDAKPTEQAKDAKSTVTVQATEGNTSEHEMGSLNSHIPADHPATLEALENYEDTAKGLSNYAKEDLATMDDPFQAQIQAIQNSEYNTTPQIYHNMVDESLTPVVTAGVTDTYDRLWHNHEEESNMKLHSVHYQGQERPMSETAIDHDGNAYEIDYSYKNWETPIDLKKPGPKVEQVDQILENVSNPMENVHTERSYDSEQKQYVGRK